LRSTGCAQIAAVNAESNDYPKDPNATINRLIEVLDNQELAAAITRLEKGYGLRLVK
jgi:hypothetical protein